MKFGDLKKKKKQNFALKIEIIFRVRWCNTEFFGGKFSIVTLKMFCDQKNLKGNSLKNYCRNNCQGKRCVNFFKFSRQKS